MKKCEVGLSRVTSSSREDYWKLSVRDSASLLVIAEVELDDEQFSNLMSTRRALGDASYGAVAPEVGKTAVLVHKTYKKPSQGRSSSDVEDEMRKDVPEGFEFKHGYWDNTGHYRATYVRYEEEA